MNILAIFGIESPSEILLILLVVLLLFGGKKLPELARSLGKSIGEFKRGQHEGHQAAGESPKEKPAELQDAQDEKPAAPAGVDAKK